MTLVQESTPGAAPDSDDEDSGRLAELKTPPRADQNVDRDAVAELQSEWGDAFDEKMGFARAAVQAIADQPLIDLLEETGLGDDPIIIRAAAQIGELLNGSGSDSVSAPDPEHAQSLNEELEAIHASDGYWSDQAQRRVRQIYLDLYGGR